MVAILLGEAAALFEYKSFFLQIPVPSQEDSSKQSDPTIVPGLQKKYPVRSSYANYTVFGNYSCGFMPDEFTRYVCTATLEVSVASNHDKIILYPFSMTASNGFDYKIQAENRVKEKLVVDYKSNHLTL